MIEQQQTASNPLSCPCELCAKWRAARGLERFDPRDIPDQRPVANLSDGEEEIG